MVYSPTSCISSYLTYNKAQYVVANDNDGAVATLGEDATTQLRQNTLLEEAGVKFDLLGKALFISTAGFKQERTVPDRPGWHGCSPWRTSPAARSSSTSSPIRISSPPRATPTCTPPWIRRRVSGISRPMPGINIDGAGSHYRVQPNQTFDDPGVPQHLFNALANYKLG